MRIRRCRNSVVGVESLESLTLLSGASAIQIPTSLPHPIEVRNQETSGTKGLPVAARSGTSSARAGAVAQAAFDDLTTGARHTAMSAAKGVAVTPRSGAETRVNADKAIPMAQSRFTRGEGHGFIGGAAGVKRFERYAPVV